MESPPPGRPHRLRPRCGLPTGPRRRPGVHPVLDPRSVAEIAPRARRAQILQAVIAAQRDRRDVINRVGIATTPPAGPPIPPEHLLTQFPPARRRNPRHAAHCPPNRALEGQMARATPPCRAYTHRKSVTSRCKIREPDSLVTLREALILAAHTNFSGRGGVDVGRDRDLALAGRP